MAVFWNASYAINDQFTVRAGGRYNDEDRKITNDSVFNGTVITTTSDIADDEKSLSEYTGEYGLDYRFNENALLYYTFSQGFRSGAALIFQSNSPIIDPTTVDSHEVGLKVQSADQRFSGSVAYFNASIENLQRTQASLNQLGLLVTAVNNVNEMDTQGVELDLSWVPVDQLRLSAAVAYVDAEFLDFATDDPLISGTNVVQVAGNTPRLTPDWKANLHGEYDFLLGNGAVLTLGGDLTYVGDQFFDEHNRAPFLEESYTLFDASLTYQSPGDDWSVAVWGKNLGDEKKLADTTFSAFGRVQSKHFINPRTWGVTFSLRF